MTDIDDPTCHIDIFKSLTWQPQENIMSKLIEMQNIFQLSYMNKKSPI